MRFDFTSVLGLVQLLALGLAVYLIALIWHTMRRLTHPPRRTYAHAIARGRPGDPGEALDGRGFESWTLKSRGLDLPVWDVPGDQPDGPVVIMLHGWGDGRVGALTRLPAIVPLASRILMPDLPGNGEAPGICSLGTRESEDLGVLIERVQDDAHRLIVFGWSMGAGIAIQAGAAHWAPGRRSPGRPMRGSARSSTGVTTTSGRSRRTASGRPRRSRRSSPPRGGAAPPPRIAHASVPHC